jgi:predicted GNAT family acetyltransferase
MTIEHLPTEQRFVARLPEGQAVLSYQMPSPAVMDIESTWVPETARGRGIGGQLVETALRYARANRLSVVAGCWYVPVWVAQHPEFDDVFQPR